MVKEIIYILAICLLTLGTFSNNLRADPILDILSEDLSGDEHDEDLTKFSAKELVVHSLELMNQKQPIAARNRLLAALEKDPNYYPTYLTLSGYYLDLVGHFRMSLKYLKKGEELFLKQKGSPPYYDRESATTHAQILILLSQIRLNLDNYQGALDALDQFEQAGYFSDEVLNSKAWILMKLGRLSEAIEVARSAVLSSFNESSALNILGILLSVSSQQEESLKIFNRAIEIEKSFGEKGKAATPLNNAGEVYRERFLERKAENYWRQALNRPDGCEHVLPSLNLSILMIEELRLNESQNALDKFKECVKQYTVRNDEEHRSLIDLAEGRVALEKGDLLKANKQLNEALEVGQWFGKIGTNLNDLKVAALQSYADTIRAQINQLNFSLSTSYLSYPLKLWQKIDLSTRLWWTNRKFRLLFLSMNEMEDLYPRHSDSMIDYPKLGNLLEELPTSLLKNRIKLISSNDNRPIAKLYYDAYLGQNLINKGNYQEGINLLKSVLKRMYDLDRTKIDVAFFVHINLILAKQLKYSDAEYIKIAHQAYKLHPAALKGYGIRLPVNGPNEYNSKLQKVGFIIDNSAKLPYKIKVLNNSETITLQLYYNNSLIGRTTTTNKISNTTFNEFSNKVFSNYEL